MNFNELINNELINEVDNNHNSLLLLDIDDTLLTASGIFIFRKLPTDTEEVKLTPAQYAQEKVTTETYYSYRDFRNPEKVGNSIKFGNPIIPNLNIMDNYIKHGWKIGILTARGLEDVIFNSLKVFLKYKNNKNELQDIGDKLIRDLTFAVNDDNKKYTGHTDYEKKKNVMLSLLDKYDRVWLLDDDIKNINAVNSLKEELKNKKDPRFGKLRAILAQKHKE